MSFYPPLENDPEVAEAQELAKAWHTALARHFGITFQQDQDGSFGDIGSVYLTLRAKLPKVGDCHITMKVQRIKRGMVS